jgi:hypothetical protein
MGEKMVLDFRKAIASARAMDLAVMSNNGPFIEDMEKHRCIDFDFLSGMCRVNDGKWHWGDSGPDEMPSMSIFDLLTMFDLDFEPLALTGLHPAIQYISSPPLYLSAVFVLMVNGITVNMRNITLSGEVVEEISSSISQLIAKAPQSIKAA